MQIIEEVGIRCSFHLTEIFVLLLLANSAKRVIILISFTLFSGSVRSSVPEARRISRSSRIIP